VERTPADRRARSLADLRISVTDRCNFRCPYCMPREVFAAAHSFLPRREILDFEEIARLAAIFVALGVRKIRLTGGEPLLRRDLPALVRQLAALGDLDLALTTNGSLLEQHADALAAAGLSRVTVSLDSLDDRVFRLMNDASLAVETVLRGIAAAERAGLAPIKINAVVRRGLNEDSILPLVERFQGAGIAVRFIEFMDVGTTNRWRHDDVVPAREILERIAGRYPLEPVESPSPAEVARRWRHVDGSGEVGIVASVTAPFCRDCTRARLSADGRLFTCLFAAHGTDLRGPLRDGASDREIESLVTAVWNQREDRYSELRAEGAEDVRRIEMSYIGG